MNTVSLRKFLFVFVADEAFALKPFMLRPFSRRKDLSLHKLVFNYRLSRARQVVENTFRILASRFRSFRRSILGKIGNIKNIKLMLFYIIFLSAKAQEICIIHQIMLTKKRHRGYLLEAGKMKPQKFRD